MGAFKRTIAVTSTLPDEAKVEIYGNWKHYRVIRVD